MKPFTVGSGAVTGTIWFIAPSSTSGTPAACYPSFTSGGGRDGLAERRALAVTPPPRSIDRGTFVRSDEAFLLEP